MRMIRAALLFLLLPALSFGGHFNDINEVIAGNSFGYSAKQMAMGGAGIMSMDGTALFYNPANLARVSRIEFNLGLSFQKYNNKSVSQSISQGLPYTADDSKNNTRLNSMILTIPYPTWRGSLVFGLGMARPVSFDRVSQLHYEDVTASIDEEIFESGGINNYAFGFGIDLSPRLAFGSALILYRGKHKLNLAYEYNSQLSDTIVYQLMNNDYSGFGLRLGLAMQISQRLGIGVTAELPTTLNVKQDVTYLVNDQDFSGLYEYNISKPYSFSMGIVGRFNYLTLVADANYIDWTQLAYADSELMEAKYNHIFKEYYRDVLSLKFGAEYVLPGPGLSLRAGYYYDPLPFKDRYLDELKTYDGKSHNGLSFGIGLLIDNVLTIDFAYVNASYDEEYLYIVDGIPDYIASSKEITYNRIIVTGAYRF